MTTPLSIAQTLTAVAVGLTSSFQASGGTAPYTYSVRANGAGGTIGSSSGIYTAPAVVNGGSYGPPTKIYDVIQAKDNVGAVVIAQILVGNPLLLFCDIIQNQLGLANGRVYLWDQKIFEPTDSGLYVAVSVLSCKPFGNINTFVGSGSSSNSVQFVSMYAQLQIDIISRDSEARDRKEEVILALNSNYALQQQDANSFSIGRLPPGGQFVNLSGQDGAAIPYRFNIAVGMQYAFQKTQAVDSYNSFQTPALVSNS